MKRHVTELGVDALGFGTPPGDGLCRVTHVRAISFLRERGHTSPRYQTDLTRQHVHFSQDHRYPFRVREAEPLFSDFPDGASRAHAEGKLSLCYDWFEVT